MSKYETPIIKITAFVNDELVVASTDTPENELDNGGVVNTVPDVDFNAFT